MFILIAKFRVLSPSRRAPTPNIQAYLWSRQDWQTSMKSFLIPSPIRPYILPKHSIPLNRLEYNTQILFALRILIFILFTLQKLAPSPLAHIRHPDPRKLRSSTLTLSINVHHKRTHSIRFPTCTTPVIVMRVMTSRSISLRPQSFNMKIWAPTLESTSTGFDASNDFVSIDECDLREAYIFLYRCFVACRNRWRLIFVFAVNRQSRVKISEWTEFDCVRGLNVYLMSSRCFDSSELRNFST